MKCCLALSCSLILLLICPTLSAKTVVYQLLAEKATYQPFHVRQHRYGLVTLTGMGAAFSCSEGEVAIEDFVARWKRGANTFHPVPPQVSLWDATGKKRRIEFRNPRYDALADTLIFEIYALDPIETMALDHVVLKIESRL